MITKQRIVFLLAAPIFLFFFHGTTAGVYAKGGAAMSITVTSTAFTDGDMIPRDHTCDGKNISPQLAWSGIPADTRSLALINDDPDAPMGTWVHWVLYGLPASVNELPQNIASTGVLENGAKHGTNDFGRFGYGGPCPPSGTHRYYFKLYALDIELTQEPGLTKDELLEAMRGHVLAEGQLMGRYKLL